ncbi:MAG: hypothetical protein SP4CHLAM5_06050 [Chlamydiia bacterium]|nr:hypothetical protein [Chlamydiia bacterium]MCH9618474.1 hypothetical protein [Chlamydiia bacterium]MCH9623936.1 hypothetical protein [Chlamydiia bacterium]
MHSLSTHSPTTVINITTSGTGSFEGAGCSSRARNSTDEKTAPVFKKIIPETVTSVAPLQESPACCCAITSNDLLVGSIILLPPLGFLGGAVYAFGAAAVFKAWAGILAIGSLTKGVYHTIESEQMTYTAEGESHKGF